MCSPPFTSIYTIFLFTKRGVGFFIERFTVNKSTPVLSLGCSFCEKNSKLKNYAYVDKYIISLII